MIFFLSLVKSTIQTYINASLNEDRKILSVSISIPSVFSNDFKAYLNESEKRHKFLKVENSKNPNEKSKREILNEISEHSKDKYFEFNDWTVFNVNLNSSEENYNLEFYFGETPVKRSLKFNIKDFVEKYLLWSLFCYCPEFIIEKLKADKNFLKQVINLESKNPKNPFLLQVFLNRKANLDKIIGLICVRGEFYKVRERINNSIDNRIFILYRIGYKMCELMEEIIRFRKGIRELKMLYGVEKMSKVEDQAVLGIEESNINLYTEKLKVEQKIIEKAEVSKIEGRRINSLYQSEILNIEEMPSISSLYHEMANIKDLDYIYKTYVENSRLIRQKIKELQNHNIIYSNKESILI